MVLELRNVSMKFNNQDSEIEVLDNINFSLEEGEIIAIVGPSGSGKTTILNLIAGLLKPTAGEIVASGEIGYMFQRDSLFEWRSIYRNVILGLEIKKKLTRENIDRVLNMLRKYGLWDFRNNYPQELSGGMRQRVALIRTLAISPSLLLLDEPFASLDYQTKLRVSEDVYKIIRSEKKATIIVTHDISEAIAMADRIIVLTPRPARIRKIHDITLTLDDERTPLSARKSESFRVYFNEIWRELNES